MLIKLRTGFTGGSIGFTDRFFNPTDQRGEDLSYFKLNIASDRVIGSVTLWYALQVDWSPSKNKAIVRVEGVEVKTLDKQANPGTWPLTVEHLHGLSYLRLRSTATGVDTAGFYVDNLSNGTFIETNRMSSTTADTNLAGAAGWTNFKWDTLVPSPGGSFSSPCTIFAAQGVKLEDSTGTVTFADRTGSQVTSDFQATAAGQVLTLRFVNPANGITPAAVSDVAFRFGSTLANNVTVKLYDVAGNELPDFLFTALPATINGTSIGWSAVKNGVSVSAIHKVVLTTAAADVWLIGSFALATTLNDIGYKGLIVP